MEDGNTYEEISEMVKKNMATDKDGGDIGDGISEMVRKNMEEKSKEELDEMIHTLGGADRQ